MRLFKTLLHSCLVDFRKNMKQFIAIVFIIGIAVTLFTGLSSNSIEFERRVNDVYSASNGNLADIWLTVNVDYDSDENDADLEKIKNIAGKGSSVETRTLIPATVSDIGSYALVYIDRPTINKEYDATYYYDEYDITKDFFFVDEQMVNKYKYNTKQNFSIGDKMPVSFDSSTLKSIKDEFNNSYSDIIDEIIKQIQESKDISFSNKIVIINFINKNKDLIKEMINTAFNKVFSDDSVNLEMKVNGIIKHPENIQNGTFSDCNFILSARTLINSIIDKISDEINFDDIYSYIEESKIPDDTKEEILKQLKENELMFNTLIYVEAESAKDSVMNDENNEYVDIFKSFYNQYVIKLQNKNDVDSVMDDIRDYYLSTYPDDSKIMALMDAENYPSNAVIQNDIVQSKNLAYCFPIIFFVVAVLVVLTTITQIMLKQRIQIGTMKAIGIENKIILRYYLFYMNFIGFVGCALGLIIGPLLIPRVMNIKYSLLYSLPTIGYSFPFIAAFASLGAVILCISLITYLIIRSELKLEPTESMRPKAPTMKFKEKKSNKTVKNVSLMMALRNIRVHLSRSFMVVIGIMGCTGLLISGMGIEDTINYGKDYDIASYLDCDYLLSYNSGTKKESLKEEILAIDGVKEMAEYSQVQTTASYKEKNVDMTIFYFSYTSPFFKYDDSLADGHWDLNSVAISESKADSLGCKVGDIIKFTYGNKSYEYVVSYIFYAFSNNSLFVYQETIPDLVETSTKAWVNLVKDSSGSFIVGEKDIEQKFLTIDGISSLTSREANNNRIESYMSSIKSMTNTIKIFALLLAVVVLINLTILNFEERKRDIATLRVLGFSRFEIAKSLIYEVMILTIVGALIGLALGFPLEYLVLSTNITPLISYKYTIFWYTYIFSFLLSVLTALVVNILISYRINKINMAESLKSIE